MHAIDVTNVIQFLPVILNQLFEVLLSIKNDDVSVNVIRYVLLLVCRSSSKERPGRSFTSQPLKGGAHLRGALIYGFAFWGGAHFISYTYRHNLSQ